jgi:hypothetical protein
VNCFNVGSSWNDGPDFTAERSQLWAWRDEGRGHFCLNGTSFQMDRLVSKEEVESIGRGNIVPFGSRPQNKMLKPKPIHYPVPALGDHRLRWQLSFMIPETRKAEAY